LIQFWRYKTLAVIKRYKNHLSFIFINESNIFKSTDVIESLKHTITKASIVKKDYEKK